LISASQASSSSPSAGPWRLPKSSATTRMRSAYTTAFAFPQSFHPRNLPGATVSM
jgi:hypothetical protein